MSTDSRQLLSLMPRGLAMKPGWTVWIVLALAAVALLPALGALGRIWRSMYDYHHGMLIAAITLVWLARSRQWIEASDVRPMRMALPLLAAAVGAWTIAYRANSELMQQVLVPVIPLLAVLAALGPQAARRLAGPLAYLYFAIPVWEVFLPALQWLTTAVAETVLAWMNVPTQVEGHHVTIPAGRFSIVEGCSGKRYLITGLAFAAIAGAMQQLRARQMLLLFASATALALITNWIRVVVVIYAGHVSDMQHYLVATEHRTFGYAIFVPLLLAIGWVAKGLGDTQKPQRAQQALPPSGGTNPKISPSGGTNPKISRSGGTGPKISPSSGTGRPEVFWPLLLISLPLLAWTIRPALEGVAVSLGRLPITTGAWQGPLPPAPAWKPHFVSPSDELQAAYAIDGSTVELYLNVYGVQSPGRELVFYENSVAPADRWSLIARLAHSRGAPAMAIMADPTDARWVIAHIFIVGGRLTSTPALAQFYYGLNALLQPVPAGTIAMAAACEGDCSAAAARIEGFWGDHAGQLSRLIPDSFSSSAREELHADYGTH